MLKSVTDMVANEFGNKWGEKIANHIITENRKAKYAAEHKSKNENNPQEPANDNANDKKDNPKNNLNKDNTRKIINQIIDEEPNLSEAEKRSLRKQTLSRLRESKNENNEYSWNQDKGWQANQEFSDFAKNYYLKSIVEIIKSGGDPNSFTSTVRILGGFELEILGKFISDLRSQYPRTSAGLDKFLEVINTPAEYIGKKIGEGYVFSKREILDYIRVNHGASQADYMEYKIMSGEQAILNELAKYSTSSNQAEVLKAAELIGIGKLAKNVLENSWKSLYKKGIINQVANDNFDLKNFEGGLHNGHAMERHVRKSTEWLKDRIDTNPRITGSTSFPDLATANKYTRETLLRNKDAIESWLLSDKLDTKPFLAEFNHAVGYGYNNKGQFFESINKVKVVLVKENNKFKIVTSHPLIDKVRK